MRDGTATLVRREDYAPPAWWIRTVDLTFDLDPQKTLVANRMRVERNAEVPRAPLRLHGEDVVLVRCLVDGQPVAFRHEGGCLVIDPPEGSEAFALEIRTTCAPAANTELSGLYTSGGGLFTQCEAEGFRRITYFLDRPDVMATYRVTLRADKAAYPVLLSNGNLVSQGELEKGRHVAVWEDPFPKPSYLFALVAADLVAREQVIRTRSGKEHLLQVWVRRGDLGKTEHAMRSLVHSVIWDEARFGLPLDLERFMIVAVGDFNMGAMENKGLNIFNTVYVLADPATATDEDHANIESVVGHEYFHNWTGNRITCRDWFQLSLKEGLTVFRDQEFTMDLLPSASARAVKRIEDVRDLRRVQFPEDAGPMAHPVRPDSYVQIDNFYTSTVYEKGAELVRMMQTLVGRAGFEGGMKLYVERHDGQAVTCDDFAQAIADANPWSPLASQLEGFKRWYAQAGTPLLSARGRYDAPSRTYTLVLEQSTAPTPGQPTKQPFVVPVALGLVGRSGRSIPLRLEDEPAASAATSRVLVLDEARQFFTFVDVDEPPVPSLLRGFSAPVALADGLGDEELLVLLAHDPDPFCRWEAGQRLALSRLLAGTHAAAAGGTPAEPDAPFVEAMRSVLVDPVLDPALKTLVLVPPGEGYVAEHLETVDPPAVHAAREAMRRGLARALRAEWEHAFESHQTPGAYVPEAGPAGRRALANLALGMLCLDAVQRGETAWPGRAFQRVKDAGNMTERQGALVALVHARSELAARAFEHFHARFANEPLVVDKWFMLQATAPEHGDAVFDRVRALLAHPDFTLANPNRARSLVGAFTGRNPGAFHRPDGAGYAWWADRVLALDALNPKLAATTARHLDRWRKLAEPYRRHARTALDRVAASGALSSDTREIVDRALADQP
jgi:aminopeptidase N